MPNLQRQIITEAKLLGFDIVKIIPAQKDQKAEQRFKKWLSEENHATMKWLEKEPERRSNPKLSLNNAKSIILVALNYYQDQPHPKKEGRIAKYAMGRDYHKVFESKLKKLSKIIESTTETRPKIYVDYGPILERCFAEKAGMGFIGKNTLLITEKLGSYVLLGEIITDLEITPTEAKEIKDQCGSCTKCIDVCPTGALEAPYKLNANKCISYLTIEHDGSIPVHLRKKIGNWLFGCDLCQDVCPLNKRKEITKEPDFTKHIASHSGELKEIMRIKDNDEFTKKYAGSPLMRAKREKLIRNACIVAANMNRTDLLPELKELSKDPSEVIKEHAIWALQELT